LALRIQVAALAAMGRPAHGVLIRRKDKKARVEELPAPSQDEALKWLRYLARLRWRGLSRPLPFAPETSCAYAHGGPDDGEALAAADKKWTRGFNSPVPGEGEKSEHTWLWDGDLDVLRGVPAWSEWTDHAVERSLFAQLARFAFGEPLR
jgi:exonuclease V gamma subunit